jgi:hypothetical protein
MKKNSIKNVDALEKEIYKRRLRLREIEKSLGQNVDHMRDNFGSMALQSLLGPDRSNSTGITGNLMLKAINNETLQNSLAELVDRLAEKVGEGIQKLTDRILHK